jgi:hypothetical protein
MAFVTEKITSEADIAYFSSFGFKNPIGRGAPTPWIWTIDRERDIFFFPLGGNGRIRTDLGASFEHPYNPVIDIFPLYCGLVLKKTLIAIKCWRKTEGIHYLQGGVEYWWHLDRIDVPLSLADPADNAVYGQTVHSPLREEVLELVRDCFLSYGDNGYHPAKGAF